MSPTAAKRSGGRVGRPPKYENKEEIERLVEVYFQDCEGEILRDDEGEIVFDKFGRPVVIREKPPTVTGLALALGFSTRQALLNYQGKKEFVDTITRAKSRVEAYTESRLFDRDGSNGAKFSLVNNFRGWAEHPKTELDEEEQRARIDLMRAKAQPDEKEETADDGFLDALSGTAAEDWKDGADEAE